MNWLRFGVCGPTAVAAVAGGSIAGDGGAAAGGVVGFADAVVLRVGDEEVAGRLRGNRPDAPSLR
jgi:hypothetical protein